MYIYIYIHTYIYIYIYVKEATPHPPGLGRGLGTWQGLFGVPSWSTFRGQVWIYFTAYSYAYIYCVFLRVCGVCGGFCGA